MLEHDSLVMLAESLYAHTVCERGAAPPVLCRHVPFATAKPECRRRGTAEAAAAEVFHRDAKHSLDCVMTAARRGGQADAVRRTAKIL